MRPAHTPRDRHPAPNPPVDPVMVQTAPTSRPAHEQGRPDHHGLFPELLFHATGIRRMETLSGNGVYAALRWFAPGFEVRPNRSTHARIELGVRGGGHECCAGTERDLMAGRAHYRPAESIVSGRVSSLGFAEFTLLLDDEPDAYPRAPEGHPGVTPITLAAYREFLSADDAARLSIEAHAAELRGLLRSVRVVEDRARPWVHRVIAILRTAPVLAPSLEELADEARVHPAHLARAFRKTVGCTPGQYLRLVRIELAAGDLASTTESITHIAYSRGFADQSHLGRHFRRAMGVTPAAFRRSMQGR